MNNIIITEIDRPIVEVVQHGPAGVNGVKGDKGDQGPKGDVGSIDGDDFPDWVLTFENGLI